MIRKIQTGKIKSRAAFYLVLLVMAIGVMFMLRTCSRSRTDKPSLPGNSGGDTIDVAIEYSPQSMYIYDDTLGGFSLDAFKCIAQREGVVFKYHPVVALSSLLDGLESGRYDIVAADIPMTLDFKDRFVFTDPVKLDKQVLVQKRDSAREAKVKSQLDLANQEVWVPAGSTVVGRLRNLSSEIGDTIVVHEDAEYGPEQLFILAARGDIPMAVVSSKVAEDMIQMYPDADISTDISFTQFHSWILRKTDSVMTDSVNNMLRRFKDSDAYSRLVHRYGK